MCEVMEGNTLLFIDQDDVVLLSVIETCLSAYVMTNLSHWRVPKVAYDFHLQSVSL